MPNRELSISLWNDDDEEDEEDDDEEDTF